MPTPTPWGETCAKVRRYVSADLHDATVFDAEGLQFALPEENRVRSRLCKMNAVVADNQSQMRHRCQKVLAVIGNHPRVRKVEFRVGIVESEDLKFAMSIEDGKRRAAGRFAPGVRPREATTRSSPRIGRRRGSAGTRPSSPVCWAGCRTDEESDSLCRDRNISHGETQIWSELPIRIAYRSAGTSA